MKYILLICAAALSAAGQLFAQTTDCPNGDPCITDIRTDPENPYHPSHDPDYTSGNDCPPAVPYTLNTFNWMAPSYPATACVGTAVQKLDNIPSPFFQTNNTPTQTIRFSNNSDFYPQDGWELVKRDMGLLMRPGQMNYNFADKEGNGLRNLADNSCVYYVMLYNRHTSMLRVIASLKLMESNQVIRVTLKQLENDPPYLWRNASGIFSHLSNQVVALDVTTEIRQVSAPAFFPDFCGRFFYADFPMAYDPCVCFFESQIRAEFDLINTSTFSASGRAVGIARDIASYWSGGYNPQRYLASFAEVPGSPNYTPGAYVDREVSAIYEREMDVAEQNNDFELAAAFYVLATAAKVGAAIASKGTTVVISGASAATQSAASGMTVAKAFKIAAPILDFLSSQFKETDKASISPMVIESELVLQGEITTNDVVECAEFSFATPGSKGADALPECCDPNGLNAPDRPTYNDALGVFALFKTPEVYVDPAYIEGDLRALSGNCGGVEPWEGEAPARHYRFRYKGDLDYAFNPRAEVNESKTDISVAIEIRAKHSHGQLDPVNMELYNVDSNGVKTFISPYLPPECLSEVVTELVIPPFVGGSGCDYTYGAFYQNENEIYLRVLIQYEFNAIGRDGNLIKDVKEYRFRVNQNIVSAGSSIFSVNPTESLPINISYEQPTTFNGSGIVTKKAWYGIKISSDLSVGPNVQKVILVAGDDIHIDPNASIDPNIELVVGSPVGCGIPNPPRNRDLVYAYCNSNSYQAKSSIYPPESSALRVANGDKLTSNQANSLQALPNPFSDDLTLRFTLEAASDLRVEVMDMSGRVVATPIASARREAGPQELRLTGLKLSPGAYIVRMQAGERSYHARVLRN